MLRRADHAERIADLVKVIEAAAESPGDRLVIAEYDGEVAGAVHLRCTTMSPINLEPLVQAISPHVFPQFRRRGSDGRSWSSRVVRRGARHRVRRHRRLLRLAGRQRFMARLALGPQAVLRVAATPLVRAMTALRPRGDGQRRTTPHPGAGRTPLDAPVRPHPAARRRPRLRPPPRGRVRP